MLKQEEDDPLPGAPLEDFQDFCSYHKTTGQGYQSRADKRKGRIQKVTFHKTDPQARKQRRDEKRKGEKARLHQVIDQMSKEEARQYLDAKKDQNIQKKQKVRDAMGKGQPILLDLVFEHKMNEKENRSLAKQIELIMRVIKQVEQPPSIHLCSFGGFLETQMQRMSYQHWAVTTHSENVKEVAKALNKEPVYLSPDAEEELEAVQQGKAYILGGLVDRTVIKDASLRRAQELGIPARKLPISQFMKGRLCLNLDHVSAMLCHWKETHDWKTAFEFAAPKRWKKEEEKAEKGGQENQLQRKQQKQEEEEEQKKEEEKKKEEKREE